MADVYMYENRRLGAHTSVADLHIFQRKETAEELEAVTSLKTSFLSLFTSFSSLLYFSDLFTTYILDLFLFFTYTLVFLLIMLHFCSLLSSFSCLLCCFSCLNIFTSRCRLSHLIFAFPPRNLHLLRTLRCIANFKIHNDFNSGKGNSVFCRF